MPEPPAVLERRHRDGEAGESHDAVDDDIGLAARLSEAIGADEQGGLVADAFFGFGCTRFIGDDGHVRPEFGHLLGEGFD